MIPAEFQPRMEVAKIRRMGLEESWESTPARRYVHLACECLTYKPGWSFDVYSGALRVRTELPDPYSPLDTTAVTNHCFTIFEDEITSIGRALRFIFEAVSGVERHEVREMFKYQGRQVHPPPHGCRTFAEMYG